MNDMVFHGEAAAGKNSPVEQDTDCRKIEDALVESERRYRRLFESTRDGVLILDAATGFIVDANPFLIDLLGYSKEQFMDKTIWDIGFFSDVAASKEHYLELLENKSIRYEDLPLKTKSGRSVHVEFVSNVHNEGNRKVVQCNIRDITERLALKKSLDLIERKFESYVEHAPGGIFITDARGRYIDVNTAASELTGYSVAQLLSMTIRDLTAKESMVSALALFDTLKEKGKASGELQFKHRSGLTRWWSVDAVKLSEHRFLGFASDITDRKRAEEIVLFLGHHDQLTDLYNRRYFEDTIGLIDTEDNLPLSLVICDINGLKLTNDSFGHAAGDALLIQTAKILTELANPDELVARIGGDEFIIVYPKTDSGQVKHKLQEIKAKVAEMESTGLSLSLSFGYETKESNDQCFMETLANAENRMHRQKLYEGSSLRSRTIDIIMQALFEKSDRESMHSKRVSQLCKDIATSMNFDQAEVNRIRMAGLVHDIGKIGIHESTLNKAGLLSADEWVEVKKHPEIGWRILSAANEFFDLADYVLYHHERWDGTGYPSGAKGEAICVEARIIALADAFDAMTNARSYRKDLSEELAVEEIIRCTGSQFCPAVVDAFIYSVIPLRALRQGVQE